MKRLKAVLFQEDSAQSSVIEAGENAVEKGEGAGVSADLGQAFIQLVPDTCKSTVVPIPAELISLHAVHLPVRTARQRRDALPFALEDAVARDLDQTHFAMCGTGADDAVLAAVLDRAVLERYVDAVPEKVLVPEQLLLSPPDPAVDGGTTWRTYGVGERVLVRCSDGTGFAAHLEMLSGLWHLAGKPTVENCGAPLTSKMQSQDRNDVAVAQSDVLLRADLRQGAFRPARGFVRPLKWLAACVALAGIGHLAIAVADTSAQRRVADDLRADASRALSEKLPNASPDDPPALVMRQLAAQDQPQRGSGFLPLLDRVSTALLDQSNAVQFRELNWSDDTLRLTVEAPNLDGLQQAEARLTAAGLQVSSGSATADAGAARAEMTVRP